MTTGQLRLYLGAAPGVGKTYTMLTEGQRRRARGTDVVAALVETHGRRRTREMAEGLETIPRRTVGYRGGTFTEMDTDAVLARHPQVALVDEFAHTNVPGSRNAKRWQDVEELLAAGIDVITTLNIQHLESLSDVARQITGVAHTETIPDEVARRASQIELVDMTPEALRRRMVHGNVYPPDRIEAALTHYFRPGNLTALRELALLWVADQVDEGLQRYRAAHGIATPWETSERIVVGISGQATDEAVIRRAARIAARTPGSKLMAVHVQPDDGAARSAGRPLDTQRSLVAAVGGSFQVVPGDDVAETLLSIARAEGATQMVLGAGRRGLFAGGGMTRLAGVAGHIDVHLVGHDPPAARHSRVRPAPRPGAPRTRHDRARLASARATALSRLATAVLAGHGDAPALLEETREMFGLEAVSLLERRGDSSWYVIASAGEHPPQDAGAEIEVPVSDTLLLAGRGRELSGEELLVLEACAVPLATGVARRQRDAADASAASASWQRSRWTVLAATSQDVREQITEARAALSGIAAHDAGKEAARLAAAWRALHRIDRLAADLGALGRLHAGAQETYLRPVDVDEVLTTVIDDLGPGGHYVVLGSLEDLPDVIADAALLTRVLTSLLADALAHSPGDVPPEVAAACTDGVVRIRVTGGRHWTVEGLPIRLARDVAEAMGDTLTCEETPGAGLVAVITLPAAAPSPSPATPAACVP